MPSMDSTAAWFFEEWINCILCCWCAYQGDDEQFLSIQKLFLEYPHPHGETGQCIECKINRDGI